MDLDSLKGAIGSWRLWCCGSVEIPPPLLNRVAWRLGDVVATVIATRTRPAARETPREFPFKS